jgi:hypothetical protein
MYLQIVSIYFHGKYKQYGTYLEDPSTSPYEQLNKIKFHTWQGGDLKQYPLEL